MDWLKQIAPTIATALGGPFGGLAYEAISKVLGVSTDSAKQMLETGKLTSDQIAGVQQAEIALKAKAQELGLDFEQLAVADRKSARDMQISTKSLIPAILSFIIIGGFAIITAMKILGYSMGQDPTIQDLLTTLRDGVILILSFYFGSSAGSQEKDQMIHNSTPIK